MRSQIVTASKRNAIHLPFAYTEQGIGMLSGLLKNKTAIKVSVDIMNAFVEMRCFIMLNQTVFSRVVNIENNLEFDCREFHIVQVHYEHLAREG